MNKNVAPWQPLEGLTVIDFSNLFPGPLATALLADLGAEVIKVEPPGGDLARTLLPIVFEMANRGKRSVMLDLKTGAGRQCAYELVKSADIVLETFRPGVAQRLGLGYEQLIDVNASLIYCSLSGYGQDGPWKDKPGHDLNYLADAGALAFSGHWASEPSRSGLPLADIAGGKLAVNAILAAVIERSRTGKPRRLDLSLFESALYCSVMRYGAGNDSDNSLVPGNDLFNTQDGHTIALALVEDHFWHNFRELVGGWEPDLLESRFATVQMRRERGDELTALLRRLVASHPLETWRRLLKHGDIPYSVCVAPSEAVCSEHAIARGRVIMIEGTKFVPFPVTVDGYQKPMIASVAPKLDQHGRLLRSVTPDQYVTAERKGNNTSFQEDW